MILRYTSESDSPVLRSLTLQGFGVTDRRWNMDLRERRDFERIWRDELLFLMEELVRFTNDNSTQEEPILSHVYGQCHPYDLTLSFRRSSIDIDLEMNKYPTGQGRPVRERVTRRGDGQTRYINDIRAQTEVKWPLIPTQYAPDKYLRKLYEKEGLTQETIDAHLNKIRSTHAYAEKLAETNIFYQLKYYWDLLGTNLNHSAPALVEIFDKARRESHSDIIIQASRILSYAELNSKYPEDPDSRLNSFLYKFSYLFAYGFNHPENTMPYIAYNAEQLRLGTNQRLALPRL